MYCAQTTESRIMHPSPNYSPAILVFAYQNKPDSSMESPLLMASNFGDTLFSQLCGSLWRIRSYKRSGGMSHQLRFLYRSELFRRKSSFRFKGLNFSGAGFSTKNVKMHFRLYHHRRRRCRRRHQHHPLNLTMDPGTTKDLVETQKYSIHKTRRQV